MLSGYHPDSKSVGSVHEHVPIRTRDRFTSASLRRSAAAWRQAALLSLAAGYAGPSFTLRAAFGPAGRRRSLEERVLPLRRAVAADARSGRLLLRTATG